MTQETKTADAAAARSDDDGPGMVRCLVGALVGAMAFLTVMGLGIALIRIMLRPSDLLQEGSWRTSTTMDALAIALSAGGAFASGFLARTIGGAGKAVAMMVVALLCATVVWGVLRTSGNLEVERINDEEAGAMALRVIPGALWVWGVPVAAALAALLGGRLGARLLHAFLGG